MPKLSYPNGRRAAATVVDPELETPEVSDQALESGKKKSEELDDASIAFQKQIDELRAADKLQKERNEQLVRDRDEAIKRANERDVEIHSLKKTTAESQLDAVSNALTAANADAVAAQRDIEAASELGDHKALAEAYKRLSRAEVNAARLEDGKAELEAQVETAKTTKVETPASKDPLDNFNLPERAKTWLRAHQDYLTDARKNAKIQALHWDVIDEGHDPYSEGYFESLESHLGLRKRSEKAPELEDQDEEPPSRGRIVSAPVSREAPADRNGERNGKVTLNLQQKEAAKIAGISEKDYAEQLLKLRAEKLNGNYGGAP